MSRLSRRPAWPSWRPRRRSGLTLAAVSALAAGAMLAGCGSSGGSGQTLTLYNGQHEQTALALASGFEAATGIHVSVTNDDEDVLADQIANNPAQSPADVIYTEDTPALEFLQDKGLLAKVIPSTLARTPAKYNSAADDWVGVSARVSVLIYNPDLISKRQLPTSVLQMANPKYQGKLALAAGETDFQPIVTSVLRKYGHAATVNWLNGLKANAGGHTYPDNETIADEVNRGAVAFGLVNQYYWYRMKAELGPSDMHSDIAYFAPHDPGYVIDVSGAAILKHSKHQAAAQKFLAYLVGKQAQGIIANPSKSISFEYPLGSGVTTMAPETPFSQLQPYPISIADLGAGSTAISLLKQAGLL